MDFETLQQVWTTEEGGTPMPVEHMIREVIEKDTSLARRVRRRDLLELVTAFGLSAIFVYASFGLAVPWPFWLAAAILAALGGVFVIERRRRPEGAAAGLGIRDGLRAAIAEADHQIRLLRSVGWWYLLPIAIVVLLSIGGSILNVRGEVSADVWARGRAALLGPMGAMLGITGGLFSAIWWMNQQAVKTHWLPHRERLQHLVNQLDANGVAEER